MPTLRKVISQYPLTVFLILTYALSWWAVPATGGLLIPYGPALAAVIVLAFTEGRSGLRDLWRAMARWRVGWRWYAIAPALVALYLFGALAINVMLGATVVNAREYLAVGVMAPLILELLLLGGMWEEPGWSGYALPKLQAHFAGLPYGLLLASLAVGLMRAVWHLPLLYYGHIPWTDLILISLAFQFIISWLYNRTRGSVLIVMLFHLTSNVLGGGVMVRLFSGADRVRYDILFAILACLIALLLARAHRWSMGTYAET